MKYARLFVFTLVFSLASVATAASATGHAWVGNATDTLASSPLNWEGGVVPVSGDAVTLPSGSVNWNLSGIVPSSLATSAALTLSSPLIVSGALNLNGGSLDLGGQPLNLGGGFFMTAGTFTAGVSPINISGNWNITGGTVSVLADTITFNGAANKTIISGGQHFGGLTVASSGATVGAGDDLNVDGALSITDGTLAIGEHALTAAGGIIVSGGTLAVGSGTIVLVGASGRPLNASGGNFSAGSSSTVEYRSAAGSVSIEPAVYGNLKVTGNNVFSLMGDTAVNGTFTVASGATFNLGGHVLSVPGGLIANAGTITDGVIRSPAASLRALDASGSDISAIKTSSGTLVLRVDDQDLNRRGAVAEIVTGALTITTVGGDKEVVNMQETTPASGVFTTAPLVVHQGAATQANGQIEVGQNDIIFAKYADPYDPSDAKTVQVAVALGSAATSGQPQIVDGPRIENWNSTNTGSTVIYGAHIVWSTDVVSASAVIVSSPQLTAPIAAGSLSGATDHDVAVSGLVRGYSYSFTVSSVTADGKTVSSQAKHFTVVVPGDRVKTAASSAVYWYLGGKRDVFPDATTYASWFPDFKGIVTVPADQLSDIGLGHVVPVRAGTYLVKIQSDPKTYAVEPYGVLRWIPTEAQAIALYGAAWSKRVRDVDVSQFVNYSVGAPLAANDVPSGFVYKSGGNEMNVVLDNVAHPLSDYDREVNGLALQFVSTVAPSTVASLASGGAVNGYNNDLDGVLKDGSVLIIAPAFGV